MSTDIKKMVHDEVTRIYDISHGYYFWYEGDMVHEYNLPEKFKVDGHVDDYYIDNEELSEVTFGDYFYNSLSVDYIASSSGKKGVEILMAWGGPSLWVDTFSGVVGGAWWSPSYTESLPGYICDEIDMLFEVDMYELEHF